jgi:hypothetical protein
VPDAQGNPVHAMMKFINLLAAETIDNTANISAAKPRLIGRTAIAGAPVDEFRYGDGITLWVLTGTGLLRRIHTSRVTGGLTVDLLTHEPVKIELPPVARRRPARGWRSGGVAPGDQAGAGSLGAGAGAGRGCGTSRSVSRIFSPILPIRLPWGR